MSIDALAKEAREADEPTAGEVLNSMRWAAEEAAGVLRSIGSPYRLMILCLLVEREKTVTEICDAIGARRRDILPRRRGLPPRRMCYRPLGRES